MSVRINFEAINMWLKIVNYFYHGCGITARLGVVILLRDLIGGSSFLDILFLICNLCVNALEKGFILYCMLTTREKRINPIYVALLCVFVITTFFHNYIFSAKTIITAWISIPSNNNKIPPWIWGTFNNSA